MSEPYPNMKCFIVVCVSFAVVLLCSPVQTSSSNSKQTASVLPSDYRERRKIHEADCCAEGRDSNELVHPFDIAFHAVERRPACEA